VWTSEGQSDPDPLVASVVLLLLWDWFASIWNLESCMMTLSAIQYCMIVIRNWLLHTEFLWLKCLQINLTTRATRLMQLVDQDLIVLPKFTQAFSNAESLVFCLMFCWSLFVIFFFVITFRKYFQINTYTSWFLATTSFHGVMAIVLTSI
jgi:hypothetical protein